MFNNEGNIKEKEDRRFYVVNAVVTTEKMECAAFVGEIETRFINNSM